MPRKRTLYEDMRKWRAVASMRPGLYAPEKKVAATEALYREALQ